MRTDFTLDRAELTLDATECTLVGSEITLVDTDFTLVGIESTLVDSEFTLDGIESTLDGYEITLVDNSIKNISIDLTNPPFQPFAVRHIYYPHKPTHKPKVKEPASPIAHHRTTITYYHFDNNVKTRKVHC